MVGVVNSADKNYLHIFLTKTFKYMKGPNIKKKFNKDFLTLSGKVLSCRWETAQSRTIRNYMKNLWIQVSITTILSILPMFHDQDYLKI